MVYHPLQAMTERKSSIDTSEVPLVAFRPGADCQCERLMPDSRVSFSRSFQPRC